MGNKEGMFKFLQTKTQSWKSIKKQFIEKLQTPSTVDCLTAASAASKCDPNLDTEDESLINLSPTENLVATESTVESAPTPIARQSPVGSVAIESI